jgi:hypothetical protein
VTEQATFTREDFAEELGPLFSLWRTEEGRECMRESLIEAGPAETARQLAQVEALLAGLATGATDAVGGLAGCLVTDARSRAAEGRDLAEAYAREEKQ